MAHKLYSYQLTVFLLSLWSAIYFPLSELLGLDFFSSSGVLGSRNATFRKLDLFPSAAVKERVLLFLRGPTEVSSSPFTGGRKQIQFPKRRVSNPKNTGRWKKSENSVILCAS
jgi:hypothetical protein